MKCPIRSLSRLDVAAACNMTDPDGQHKRVLDTVCKKLEDAGLADLEWPDDCVIYQAYRDMGEKRYKIDLHTIGKVFHKS